MADYATQYTDKQIDLLEAEIAKVYREAQKDIRDKMQSFYRAFADKARAHKADLASGKITLTEYQNWLRGQVFQSKRWKEKQDSIAKTLTLADRKAAEIINKRTPDVFRENANYTAYDIERGMKGTVSFNLYDSKSVERLMKDKPELLPRRVIDGRKANAWNQKEIANAVAQGIIQGESIPDLAKRIARDTGIKNGNSSMLYARTAMTGAQNAGRMERLHDAQDMGINVKKKWLATLDQRTRDTHRELDGQEQPIDEPFKVDGMEIDYPGDPTADPGLTYNCRCTLIYVYPKYQHLQHAQRYDQEAGKPINYTTYKQWSAAKQSTVEVRSNVVQGKDISATWQRRPDKFAFEIEDVINAQGFDGLPRVVSTEEFDKYVNDSGFIAQRGYTAPDAETLKKYEDQLYAGEWYVDCSKGGSMYGKGMYCDARFGTYVNEQMESTMARYGGNAAALGFGKVETFTLTKDAKILDYKDIEELKKGIFQDRLQPLFKGYDFTNDEKKFIYSQTGMVSTEDLIASSQWATNNSDRVRYIYENFMNSTVQERSQIQNEVLSMDTSSLAVLKGYDAINCENIGIEDAEGYFIILNRTKVIFRRSK